MRNKSLLPLGYGITNIVPRATATAAELAREELRAGAVRLAETVRRYRPYIVAVLGVQAYRQAFERPEATVGQQEERLGDAILWVLPNPSGLNAHYQIADLAQLFRELRLAAEQVAG